MFIGLPAGGSVNIELIETDRLIDELMRRFDHAVFAGMKVQAEESQYERWFKTGNLRTCQGLAFGIIARCEDHRRAVSEPTVGDSD